MSSWFSLHRHEYPDDWPELARQIKEQAGWKCVWCGAEHLKPHPETGKRTILTVAHVDCVVDGNFVSKHDKSHRHPEALLALCDRCHLRYDHADHVRNAAETRRSRRIEAGQVEMSL